MFLVGTRPLRRTLAAASWQNHITDEDRSSLGAQRLPSGIRDDRAHPLWKRREPCSTSFFQPTTAEARPNPLLSCVIT